MEGEILLEVKDLKTYVYDDERRGFFRIVDGVSFKIPEGKTVALIGESGSGKSITALSIMRLLPEEATIDRGKILLSGLDLLRLPEYRMRDVRGSRVSMIFQEPMTSLNPIFTVGHQIEEAIIFHQERNKKEARQIALDMLKKVELPSPEEQLNEYPHQLSGGMKQRVMIAMALSCGPKLLIADEPATALDVTIQREILELLLRLQNEYNMSILLITHDLGVVNLVAERIAVMYASKIAEYATRDEIFSNPKHPYTIGLLNSIPKIGEKRKSLQAIPGQPPDPLAPIEGCRFHPRCFFATKKCIEKEPVLEEISPDHKTACWRHSIVDKQSWLEYSKRGNKNAIM